MGSAAPDALDNERPQTPVVLGCFFLGRFPVTNAQFEQCDPAPRAFWPPWAGDNHSGVSVSATEAGRFCQWLSQREGVDTGFRPSRNGNMPPAERMGVCFPGAIASMPGTTRISRIAAHRFPGETRNSMTVMPKTPPWDVMPVESARSGSRTCPGTCESPRRSGGAQAGLLRGQLEIPSA